MGGWKIGERRYVVRWSSGLVVRNPAVKSPTRPGTMDCVRVNSRLQRHTLFRFGVGENVFRIVAFSTLVLRTAQSKLLPMLIEGFLELADWCLRPAGDWAPQPALWTMLRVGSGVGYLQSQEGVLELAPGDSACLAGESAGSIRASQLGQMRIHSFVVSTEFLAGLLTPAERYYLDGEARRGRLALRYFPASHAVAREFARVAETRDSTNALVLRCRLLQL